MLSNAAMVVSSSSGISCFDFCGKNSFQNRNHSNVVYVLYILCCMSSRTMTFRFFMVWYVPVNLTKAALYDSEALFPIKLSAFVTLQYTPQMINRIPCQELGFSCLFLNRKNEPGNLSFCPNVWKEFSNIFSQRLFCW